jgi:hypothetical protein
VGWTAPAQVSGPGNGTFPATASGVVVFSTDRDTRPQHDVSQSVRLAPLVAAPEEPVVPEIALPAVALGAAALAGAAVALTRRTPTPEQHA